MEFLKETLHLPFQSEAWTYADSMAYYIQDHYRIMKARLGEIDMLFLYPIAPIEKLDTIKRHIIRIQQKEMLPVVFVLNEISSYRKSVFIQHGIAFVVPGKQMYLPFLGILLKEERDPQRRVVQTLQPSAQALLFYYMYQKKECLYTHEAVKALGYSAMAITKSARQLVDTGCFTEKKDGVYKILQSKLTGKALFSAMLPRLTNPVHQKLYVDRIDVADDALLSGISALAEYSMISAPAMDCCAVVKKKKLFGTDTLIDSDRQVKIEFYKYDPHVLTKGKTVDPLSLYMSLKDCPDERVQAALEEMMDHFWEEYHGEGDGAL